MSLLITVGLLKQGHGGWAGFHKGMQCKCHRNTEKGGGEMETEKPCDSVSTMPTKGPCWPPKGAHAVPVYCSLQHCFRLPGSCHLNEVADWVGWETESENLEQIISLSQTWALVAVTVALELLPSKNFLGGIKCSDPSQRAAWKEAEPGGAEHVPHPSLL